MGNRLSKIYTRTGDDGSTCLGNGERTAKDDARVEAYGTVDELNSALGLMAAGELPAPISALVSAIQQKLFDLGGELCIPNTKVMTADDVTSLETALDELNAELPPLKDFVLPGRQSGRSRMPPGTGDLSPRRTAHRLTRGTGRR